MILFSTCILIFNSDSASGYPIVTSLSFSNETLTTDDDTEASLHIVEVVSFNNTTPSSVAVDALRNLVYVSVNTGYPHNYSLSLCQEEKITSSFATIPSPTSACSAIYILDGDSGIIKDIVRLSPGERVRDIDIDTGKRMIYASGEYNYLDEDRYTDGELIQYEDDVIYTINKNNNSNNLSWSSDNINRTALYGELEEGKEGDMSEIAVDPITDTIYAGILYHQGGREGVFIITNGSANNNYSLDKDNKVNSTDEGIRFIQMGRTGLEQILIDETTNTVYASLKHDDFIAIINGLSGDIKEKIILQEPRSMSFNPTNSLLYVASGDSHWFNVINMSTNKVIAVNTQISYPIASVSNNITGKVYVANCLHCDEFDFTNGTSIYELNRGGSTINWKTYENIDLTENRLAINPFTDKLYAIGTDVQSGMSNLYIIDISLA